MEGLGKYILRHLVYLYFFTQRVSDATLLELYHVVYVLVKKWFVTFQITRVFIAVANIKSRHAYKIIYIETFEEAPMIH